MLHEITCFFLGGMETPNVWLITAFWTGSIWKTNSGGTLLEKRGELERQTES